MYRRVVLYLRQYTDDDWLHIADFDPIAADMLKDMVQGYRAMTLGGKKPIAGTVAESGGERMEQERQDKLNQMEADAHKGVFSERDVCALIQCYREKCAEFSAVPVEAIQTLYHVAFGSSVRPRINDTLNTVGAWLDSLETVDAAMTENEVFTKLTERVSSLNSRKPKPGYVWAMLWYPGWRKELVEVLPEQVDPLDTALHRLENNRKAHVALANVVAVARQGW